MSETVGVTDLASYYPVLRPNSERVALDQQLRFCRRAVIARIEDLTDDEAAARPLPTTRLSAGGIAKHLAWVEDHWFVGKMLGRELPEPWRSAPLEQQPDWPFDSSYADAVSDLVDLYQEACDRSDAAVESMSLDDLAKVDSFGQGPVNVRWLLAHMINETSWHLGHLDLLRDGLGVRRAPS